MNELFVRQARVAPLDVQDFSISPDFLFRGLGHGWLKAAICEVEGTQAMDRGQEREDPRGAMDPLPVGSKVSSQRHPPLQLLKTYDPIAGLVPTTGPVGYASKYPPNVSWIRMDRATLP